MNDNITTIIITVVTLAFSGGAWKFYEMLVRNSKEKKKADKSEKTIFRDDLICRVKKLEDDKENCMTSLMDINKQVASLSTKVEFLSIENERLKIKLGN